MPFNNDANDEKQTNTLKNARIKHPPKVCLSHININSIRSKLDSLFEFTYGIVDFLAVSERKLDILSQQDSLTYQDLEHPTEKFYRGRVEDYLFMWTETSI